MKTRIVLFALIVCAFAVIGFAGTTPAAVDRFGDTQQGIQRFEPPVNDGVVEAETMPFIMPLSRFGALSLFGLNYFQAEQKPAAYTLPYRFGGPLKFFNDTQLIQYPLEGVLPYNPDTSLSSFILTSQ